METPKSQNKYTLPGFGKFGTHSPKDKLLNFNIVANEGFKNYVLFCTYSELLASYLYPFVSQWTRQGLGCLSKNTKADNDNDFCMSMMNLWHYNGESPPLPPQYKDYCQRNYRIRLIAAKEKLLADGEYQIDYELIRTPNTKAPPSLEIIIQCIRFFPWRNVINTDKSQDLQDYLALKKTFVSCTEYFKYACSSYISNNGNNFTIDHDPIGRFWFNQDCLFKCLHHLARLSVDGIEFPLDHELAEYLKTLRVASLESEDVIRNLLISPYSQHYRMLMAEDHI